jgi:two-component system alkaline phosphatase synthesis response regulator PhoP
VSKAKILVVDDEQSIIDLVSAYLRKENYEVFTAMDGQAGLKAAQVYQPDLIVLDIMLPGMDGLELLSQLRRVSDVYVIMLTAKTEETDKVIGLSVGADDYLTKPFSPRELVARIKAALRRLHLGSASEATILAFRRLRLDTGRRQGLVLSREQLLEQVWGHDFYGEDRVVDVHIGHIRQKLGDDGFIITVRGVGYRFEDELL